MNKAIRMLVLMVGLFTTFAAVAAQMQPAPDGVPFPKGRVASDGVPFPKGR
jgi:hypothetical protein